jgi:hypothetical protein
VETRYLVAHDVYHYAVPVQNYHAAFGATVAVQHSVSYGGAHWNAGPPPGQVSREIGQPIRAASLHPPPAGTVQAHQMIPAAATAPSGHAANSSGAPHPEAPGSAAPAKSPQREEGPEHGAREGAAVEPRQREQIASKAPGKPQSPKLKKKRR